MLWFWAIKHVCPTVLVIRQFDATHKNSTYVELGKAIEALGATSQFIKYKSPLEYVHKASGAKIIFKGFDDASKLTSISATTPLCWIVVEEAFEIRSEDEFNKLDLSIRGILPEGLFYQVIMMLNPWSAKHWIKKRFFDTVNENVYAVTKNYTDNIFLNEDFVKSIDDLAITNPRMYNIVGKGEWGVSHGLVFDNWDTKEFNVEEMLSKKSIYSSSKYEKIFGVDFGWTDPTTVICALKDEVNKEIFIYDELYQSKVSIKMLCDWIKMKKLQNEVFYCDSANPREITEMRSLGIIRAKGCTKGPNSIVSGIKILQGYKIHIKPNCKHTLGEFSSYAWSTDKTSGLYLDVPESDGNDHLIDALRYCGTVPSGIIY
jgi:phage terminase large subunit